MADPPGGRADQPQPVGPLLKQFSDQATRLVRHEIELAKTELTAKGQQAGIAAGLFGVAGVLGLLALLTLTAAMVLALATALAAWLAALIVTAFYGATAVVLGVFGRARVGRALPLAPRQAIKSVREDIAWIKNRAKSARR